MCQAGLYRLSCPNHVHGGDHPLAVSAGCSPPWTWFGQLSGYKPAWHIATRVLQYLQEVTRIQRDPASKIKLASASKCSYPHYQAIIDHIAN